MSVYGLAKGMSAGLGAVSLLKDFGVHITQGSTLWVAVGEVLVDAKAG